MDSATMIVDKNSTGMKLGMTVSEFGNTSFSKSGKISEVNESSYISAAFTLRFA
jgi:hypothetical protein